MKYVKQPKRNIWTKLVKRPEIEQDILNEQVEVILKTVKEQGDQALKTYCAQFDGVELEQLLVSQEEIERGIGLCTQTLKESIELAKSNIEIFHNSQQEKEKVVETMKGVSCWRSSVGIERVGLYIPGGSAPLFSTILMLGVPAQIAGCNEVILCTPPNQNGEINPAILYTANLVGVRKIFKVGGAQAIGAMAYGTETIPQVDKIFGPGNQYVTKAKSMIQQEGVAIDMPAGPSEVLVITDQSSNPEFVAADLLSQAEHGSDSQVVLLSANEEIIQRTLDALQNQVERLPRKETALLALENSQAILLESIEECIAFSNLYAPEHLILAIEDAETYCSVIQNAGSVFLGHYSCESAGDYASGTNHTLPTNGFAKSYSGVSLDSFVKKITFQKLTKEGLRSIGPAIEVMAEAEGLDAHKNAVTIRLNALQND